MKMDTNFQVGNLFKSPLLCRWALKVKIGLEILKSEKKWCLYLSPTKESAKVADIAFLNVIR